MEPKQRIQAWSLMSDKYYFIEKRCRIIYRHCLNPTTKDPLSNWQVFVSKHIAPCKSIRCARRLSRLLPLPVRFTWYWHLASKGQGALLYKQPKYSSVTPVQYPVTLHSIPSVKSLLVGRQVVPCKAVKNCRITQELLLLTA